jgi:sugar lactone lactonase YvrE
VPAPDGGIYFTDIPKNTIHRVAADGKVSIFLENTRGTNGLAFGPDGRLYGCRAGSGEVVSWDLATKQEKVHASGLKANDLVAVEDIMPISSRLVVNRAALKTRHTQLQPLLDAFERASRE